MGKQPFLAEGVSLTDISLASIHLKDELSIPIAQVHGSSEYQALMRRAATPEIPVLATKDVLCHLSSPALDTLPSVLGPLLNLCLAPDVTILKTMFRALNTAVESYLGTNICFAAIVLDFIHDHVANSTQDALQALDLRQVLGRTLAGRSEVRAYALHANEMDESETILAVDYSTRWFNIGLYTLEIFELIDPVLGFVDGLRIGEEAQLEAFETAVRSLAENFPPHVRLPDRLVLYGDEASNPEVLDIVESMFGRKLRNDAYISTSAFRGVSVVARGAFEYMDTVDFEMTAPASFGCRWRSRLYSEEQTEL